MSQSGNLLLLTGATGFIGFRTLIHALEAGWKVRAAVRSESKASGVKNTQALKDLHIPESALTFAVVPDITAPGAYREAIRDVTHVIHVAAAIPSQYKQGHENADEVFIKPAVRGVVEILEAARSSSSVQKVVITSSAVALMPREVWAGIEISNEHYTAASRTRNIPGPYDNPGTAYCASKIASLNETDAWVQTNKPSFDVVNIHPAWVFGPADHVKDREEFRGGTNIYLVGVALGNPKELFGDRRFVRAVIHVDDVASLQVMALDSQVKGYRGFIASVPGLWQDITDRVSKKFQEAVKTGLFRTDATQNSAPIDLDGSETERAFNIKFKTFEEIIDATLHQYANLPEKA